MQRSRLGPGANMRVVNRRTLPYVGASVSLAILCGSAAQETAPPPPIEVVETSITPAERMEVVSRTLAEATLTRSQMMRALSSLPTDIAAVVVDSVFHDYATAIGAVRERAHATLFDVDGEEVLLRPIDGTALVGLARELSQTLVEATSNAAREIADAGAVPGRSAEEVEADLLRALVAFKFQSSLKGFHDDRVTGYDILLDFAEARRTDRGVDAAAGRADSDADALADLRSAESEFRRVGAELGRAIVARAGAGVALSRTRWGGEPEPHELTRIAGTVRADMDRWMQATDALAEASERHLMAGGDPVAAARWRLRTLRETKSSAIVVASWGQSIARTAQVFGASPEELDAMRRALDENDVARLVRAKSTLAAYGRWLADVKANGQRPTQCDPSDELVRALEAQAALERSTRARVLAEVRSPALRAELESLPAPDESYRAPFWIQAWRQRADQTARQADQPQAEAQGEEGARQ